MGFYCGNWSEPVLFGEDWRELPEATGKVKVSCSAAASRDGKSRSKSKRHVSKKPRCAAVALTAAMANRKGTGR